VERQPFDQTLRVYDPEASCFNATEGRVFNEIGEVNAWLQDFVASRWFRLTFPCFKSCQIHDGRGHPLARGWTDENAVGHIALPRAARYQQLILHELTHALGYCSHDCDFCAVYLQLVHRGIGRPAWLDLKEMFDLFEVRYRRHRYRATLDDGIGVYL